MNHNQSICRNWNVKLHEHPSGWQSIICRSQYKKHFQHASFRTTNFFLNTGENFLTLRANSHCEMTSISAVACIFRLVVWSDDPCSLVSVFPSYVYSYVFPGVYLNFPVSERDAKIRKIYLLQLFSYYILLYSNILLHSNIFCI